jgi:drug/metabolite transporter (DMT)-like permease
MIYFFLSICSTVSIYLLFKWFEKQDIRLFDAIVANYFTATCIGLVVIPNFREATLRATEFPLWLMAGLGVGVLFISVFYLIGLSSQRVGVSITTIASKMSLALAALLFALFDPSERLQPLQVLALAMALGGVVFSSLKKENTQASSKLWLYPLAILLGSTIIDFVLGFFGDYTNNNSELALFSMLPFSVSLVIGSLILGKRFLATRQLPRLKDLGAGILLGSVNYVSIYALVKAYQANIMSKTALLPTNNLAVVLLGSAVAYVVFGERFTRTQWFGIVLSICAMALLVVGK